MSGKESTTLNKYLLYAGIFFLGVLTGWLNPIEGPLDWTYDDYASQPAHKKYPTKVAPMQKIEKELMDIPEEEEENQFPEVTIIDFTNNDEE